LELQDQNRKSPEPKQLEKRRKMDKSRFKPYLIITLALSGLLPIAGSTFLHLFLLGQYWNDEPLHSVFEALGSFTALSLALLILILQKDKRVPSYYMWVSYALIGMGILDGFHAFSLPGNSFVWLHGMAVFVGGFLFAMVWLPERVVKSRLTSVLHIMVAVVTVILGVFIFYSPDTLPAMINEGVFTSLANTINMLGGLFFLSAAVYFAIHYRSDPSHEDFLFLNFCLLNGWAGMLFRFSQIWQADWWFWHVLRLVAYLIVLSYMFITFQRSEAELKQHREHLEELVQKRTTELKIINEQLQQEINERIYVEEEKNKLIKAIASSTDGIAITDAEDRYIYINAAHAMVYSYSQEELIGKTWREITQPDMIAPTENILDNTLHNKEIGTFSGEFLGIRKDGTIIPTEVRGKALWNEEGNYRGHICIVRDITERKQVEEKLRKAHDELEIRVRERTSELAKANDALQAEIIERKHAEENTSKLLKELKTIFENLPLGIAYLDAEFKLVNANKFFFDLTGFSEEDLIGKPCYETVGEYADSSKKGLEKICSFCKKDECFNTRRPTIIERPLEGSIIKVTTVPQLDEDGNIVRFLEIIENITERKLSEVALRESEERYRKLVESSPDAIAIHNEGKIIFTNPSGAKLLGAANPGQLIGKEIMDFVHPDYREPVKERIQKMKGEQKDIDLIGEKFVRLDGSVIDVEVATTPFIHQGKHGMQVIVRDVTEKKKLEAQFLRGQRLESIGTLASGIAHDINNVLTPIMLSLELLQEKITDNDSQKLITVLERSAQRGANLVKQVQSFAQGVQGERVSLQVVHLISEISQIAKETFPRAIEIKTDIQKDLWTISGDVTQLHQVVMNLCVNARDAMPYGGSLSISAENLFIDENYARMNIDAKVGQYVVITVSDTGTGIPPEILDRIFEPFFTTKQHGKGTGLGLFTAIGIVKSHGGFINVYSETGKGTVFKVYMPIVKSNEAQKVDEQQLELLAGHGELILVVDDETMIREITGSILETNGYRVLMANDGAQAIKVYTQNREEIKVVVMDMMMPVMDGQTCIRALRKVNPDIQIIAVSGLAEKEKLAKVAVTHVKAFLPKPYTAKILLKTIHEVVNAK
jgi:PAS domain S-box-containing protein